MVCGILENICRYLGLVVLWHSSFISSLFTDLLSSLFIGYWMRDTAIFLYYYVKFIYPLISSSFWIYIWFPARVDIVFFPSDLTPHHYISSCFMWQCRIKLYFIWCKKSPSCLYSCSWVMVKLPLSWYFQFVSDFEFQEFVNVCAYRNFLLLLLVGMLWA